MKTFKSMCAALVLALSLSIPVYSGDGHTPGSPAPSPTPAPSQDPTYSNEEPTVAGEDSFLTVTDFLWILSSIY
jgi:hypothetical protein